MVLSICKTCHGGCKRFLDEFSALFLKTFRLAIRRRGQTIVEILLAYGFMFLLIGLRYLLDRVYNPPFQLPPFRPYDRMIVNNASAADTIYYYPSNLCTDTIVKEAINNLVSNLPDFPNKVAVIPNVNISLLSNTTLESLYAYIHFTNLDSCANLTTMPDQVRYTLRMQEQDPYYYRAQQVKLNDNDILWKRAPQEFCQGNSTFANYTTQFLGIQYFVDLSIIQYATNIQPNSSSVFLNHFGCPAFYSDDLHTSFSIFVPIFFALVYLITFILNIGYIVEERQNKTKEYLRIFGLRTWVNNIVWVVRSMCILFVLTCVVTGFSFLTLSSSNQRPNSVSKAIFSNTHWTLVWTVFFVYSIHTSAFSVFVGQFFKRPLLAKLIGAILWIITSIDFYAGVPVGVRYFLCLFPNAGLLFCLQVILQYERRSGSMATFNELYSNIFTYKLYIGVCLLLMLIYSVIYMLLAIYVERVNPGEFGVAQPWNYLFKKPASNQKTTYDMEDTTNDNDRWIQRDRLVSRKPPALSIRHLTKKFGKFQAVSDLSLNFYEGEVCSLLGHNGAGKTTTTFILVGMLEPTSGTVLIEGMDNRERIQEVRQILGFCPQYDILYDELSVEEHLVLIAKMRHVDEHTMKESIEMTLNLIGLVNDRQTLSKNLSGGMKRRLSIGISVIGNPKVLILDEPTSGIDPHNRRLIWTIVRKLRESGKCVLLTTHFLEEADVLSDRIAFISKGRLQAHGTPDFLKQQTEYEYRIFMDKHETCDSQRVVDFVREYVPNTVLERESASELIFGIKRGKSKKIEELINVLDEKRQSVGINSYGLSMPTIEDVFLKLLREEEMAEDLTHNPENTQHVLSEEIFHQHQNHIQGSRLFFTRFWALLIKRWHVTRRHIGFLLGFFALSIVFEIILVGVLPTPEEIQLTLLQNDRIIDAQVQLIPSNYNPQTIVTYSNNDQDHVRQRLVSYLSDSGATVEEIFNDNVLEYILPKYYQSEDAFVNKYKMGFASYNLLNDSAPILKFNSYFSTVNYHTMPTSLGVATTNLFQFYANSSQKSIIATNQPISKTVTVLTPQARAFQNLLCFDSLPVSVFNFLFCVIATLYISILIPTFITERVSHSKDLQLLTNVKRRIYWLSNFVFDISLCLILCSLLTIILKIGAAINQKEKSEVYIYRNAAEAGYFFLMFFMYSLASLPFIYVFSFWVKREIIGVVNFFLVNVLICFADMILSFVASVAQEKDSSPGQAGMSSGAAAVMGFRWFLSVMLPSVNLKRALSNIRLRPDRDCITSLNSLLGTNYAFDEPWMSAKEPGLGLQFLIFWLQIIAWWLILIIIESFNSIRQLWQRRCNKTNQLSNIVEYDDSKLDEDVRRERESILRGRKDSTSSVVVVRDLIKQFTKSERRSCGQRVYTAVDHLNFRVSARSCFGLLGANGAGKTTTFRMLIDDLKPTSGEIIINGKNINKMKRDLDIGFCPQFDWLVEGLSVHETIILFARLKGLQASSIPRIARSMIQLFGLETYEEKLVQNLSGGNKRKLSAVIAFMGNPALVFLDEPTTGLDAAAKRKLWKVIRVARDMGLTIIMTSHSMEECEALCTRIGIMRLGQFMCLGNLQRLKNRFGDGYAVQVKVSAEQVEQIKNDLISNFPRIQIEDQQNGVLFCNIPFSSSSPSLKDKGNAAPSFNLGRIFSMLNVRKDNKLIESYALSQTTLEQIFIRLAGEDEDASNDPSDSELSNQTDATNLSMR